VLGGPRACGGYLFVDFLDLDAARAFAHALAECPGSPIVLDRESSRFAADRFRPQMTKRLGPGLLAAEVLMPSREVKRYLPRPARWRRTSGPSSTPRSTTSRTTRRS